MEHQSENEKALKREIAFHCAPVIAGVKPSNLLILPWTGDCRIRMALENTDVSCMCLYAGGDKTMCFLYREKDLEALADREENRRFLISYGYHEFDVRRILIRMKARFLRYQTGIGEFPHEMGILLGYPLADVNGFIVNQGKDYLLSGYWKVYENPENARKLFGIYTRLREEAVKEVDRGKALWQIERRYMERKYRLSAVG